MEYFNASRPMTDLSIKTAAILYVRSFFFFKEHRVKIFLRMSSFKKIMFLRIVRGCKGGIR